jgi:hypothetical protein
MFRNRFAFRFFCILALLLLPGLAAAQNNLFTTTAPNAVASLPLAIATGDFNSDGDVDTAVTSSGTNQVSVLLGAGDGNFKPAVNYAVGADPVAIGTGDFNHDGHLDLAVLNSNPNKNGVGGSISILVGVGDGTFVAGATYAVGFIPTALITSDFDGDGSLDLAVVISNPNLQRIGALSIQDERVFAEASELAKRGLEECISDLQTRLATRKEAESPTAEEMVAIHFQMKTG